MNIQQWHSGSKGQCALHLLHIEHAKLMSGHRGFPDYQETFSNSVTGIDPITIRQSLSSELVTATL